MKEKLKLYLDNNFINEEITNTNKKFKSIMYSEEIDEEDNETSSFNINNFIDEFITQNNFQSLLFFYIDKKNLKDSDVYNKVHIDRRLFSKIRSDAKYHPSKETIILLAISLQLNEQELLNLLESASYSLPKNNYYDLIIRFCFINKIYDIKKINELLDEYNCKLFSY